MSQTHTARQFHWIGYAEGISLLVLLIIAMPLKYLAGIPEVVLYTGWIHGLLFITYLLLSLAMYRLQQWSWQLLLASWVAAFLPLGTFYFDRYLRKRQDS